LHPQVLRYELGQKYDAHHDVGELESKSGQQLAADGGFRAATSLLYLSTVEEGGETVFPYSEWIDPSKATATTYSECGRMGVAAKPIKGDVLLFWSITLDGKIDPASMHAGCPVIRGTKWTGEAHYIFCSFKSVVNPIPPSLRRATFEVYCGPITTFVWTFSDLYSDPYAVPL
jgi:hypothetical protein